MEIAVVDRTNHPLFQPLLYQVATAGLAAPAIAEPIRRELADQKNVTVLLGEVQRVDVAGRTVVLENGEALAYDRLIVATGATDSYFGHDEWRAYAPKRAAWLTFVVIGATLGVPLDRGGRVIVESDLTLPDHPEIQVIGDLATILSHEPRVPGVAPAAKQMGRHAARNILAELAGQPTTPFRYRDYGQLATIGRSEAVALFGKTRLWGWLAWITWLTARVFFLTRLNFL